MRTLKSCCDDATTAVGGGVINVMDLVKLLESAWVLGEIRGSVVDGLGPPGTNLVDWAFFGSKLAGRENVP
jgi:hypothetical protein